MSDLFDMPETLSPRAAWHKKHGVKTHCSRDLEQPWAAWSGDIETAIHDDTVVIADTEDEALAEWARRNKVPLWNEEGYGRA